MNEIINIIGSLIKDTSWLELAIKWIIAYFAFFWLALVIWVSRDAINRSNNVLFHVASIVLNLILPIFWLMIYLLVRPPRTLMDKYYEDLEYQALADSSRDYCPKCNSLVERDYLYCWECGESLMCSCPTCNKVTSKKFKICPYCWEKKKKNQKPK